MAPDALPRGTTGFFATTPPPEATALPIHALDGPVEPGHLARLAEAEHAQIRYWRPTRLGDSLFNAWD